MSTPRVIEQVLELARWAPSGDNTQPWRFEVVDESNLIVHGFDTRDHCVYDLDGRPSQISLGALLETISIAASAHGLSQCVQRRTHMPDTTPTFDVQFTPDVTVRPDPLISSITRRSVQRRPMSARALTAGAKAALEASLGTGFRIIWLEGFRSRLRAATLMFMNAKLRLTMPEAYLVHRDVIAWRVRYSEDRVPDQALGVDAITARLMRWVMADWGRVEFFNKYLFGTLAPRLQMDLLPGLLCGAHYVISANRPPHGIDDYVAAGRAVQRFWLTLTDLGLVMQPELTPLIFGRYVRDGVMFSKAPGMQDAARKLLRELEAMLGEEQCRRAVFMGRIGAGTAATSRSTRRKLDDLLVEHSA